MTTMSRYHFFSLGNLLFSGADPSGMSQPTCFLLGIFCHSCHSSRTSRAWELWELEGKYIYNRQHSLENAFFEEYLRGSTYNRQHSLENASTWVRILEVRLLEVHLLEVRLLECVYLKCVYLKCVYLKCIYLSVSTWSASTWVRLLEMHLLETVHMPVFGSWKEVRTSV